MRSLNLALLATCLTLPAMAEPLDPRILLGAQQYERSRACDWSRAHIVFNNNTKSEQTARVWYASEAEAAKSPIEPFATVKVAPGQEQKLFLQSENAYILHTVVMDGTRPLFGTQQRFHFPVCEKAGQSVAYMWTWTKTNSVQPSIRKK
jgi:hypothetical protein